MRYIENSDLREWVKESLRKTIFQKAHSLAIQTGCEILVKLEDNTDTTGSQYYATSSLQQAFKHGGVCEKTGDLAVSGETGLPVTPMVDMAVQSSASTVPDPGGVNLSQPSDSTDFNEQTLSNDCPTINVSKHKSKSKSNDHSKRNGPHETHVSPQEMSDHGSKAAKKIKTHHHNKNAASTSGNDVNSGLTPAGGSPFRSKSSDKDMASPSSGCITLSPVPVKQFQCPVCGKKLKSARSLQKHTKTFHSQEQVPSASHGGGVASRSIQLEEQPVLTPISPERYPCQKCDQTFDCPDYLEAHMKDFHKKLSKHKPELTTPRKASPSPRKQTPKRENLTPRREDHMPWGEDHTTRKDRLTPKRESLTPKQDNYTSRQHTPRRENHTPKQDLTPKRDVTPRHNLADLTIPSLPLLGLSPQHPPSFEVESPPAPSSASSSPLSAPKTPGETMQSQFSFEHDTHTSLGDLPGSPPASHTSGSEPSRPNTPGDTPLLSYEFSDEIQASIMNIPSISSASELIQESPASPIEHYTPPRSARSHMASPDLMSHKKASPRKAMGRGSDHKAAILSTPGPIVTTLSLQNNGPHSVRHITRIQFESAIQGLQIAEFGYVVPLNVKDNAVLVFVKKSPEEIYNVWTEKELELGLCSIHKYHEMYNLPAPSDISEHVKSQLIEQGHVTEAQMNGVYSNASYGFTDSMEY